MADDVFPRSLNHSTEGAIGYYGDWVSGEGPDAPFYHTLKSCEGFLISEGHKRYREGYRDGGAFALYKRETIYTPSAGGPVYRNPSTKRFAYNGGFVGSLPDLSYIGYYPNSYDADWHNNNDPSTWGATAWARLKPAQPSFDGLLNILELKDVPKLLKDSYKDLFKNMGILRNRNSWKSAGEYHLALQFGWLPLLGATREFIATQRKEQKIVDQLIRDAGRPVRRNGTLLDESTSQEWSGSGGNAACLPTLVSHCYRDAGTWSDKRNSIHRVWASGRFRYWLPDGPQTVEWKTKVIDRIYGLRPTPSVVYNLMPWSWLADYFTNVGDFASAVSGGVEDRLVADYFYVMSHREENYTQSITLTLDGPTEAQQVVHTPVTTGRAVSKRRTYASPFGFGFTDSGLSGRQQGILGALALSKLP